MDPDNRWMKFINRVIDETDPHYAKTMLLNLGYEAFFRGTKTIRANREKYHCNIPWLILFDPTMACNMHCVGCWSGTYGHKANLTFEQMDRIVTQGKELGVYLYMMTGGEPTVRMKDIFKRKGYKFFIDSPTNQQFIILDNEEVKRLSKDFIFTCWGKYDESHTTVRFVTSWATKEDEITALEKHVLG